MALAHAGSHAYPGVGHFGLSSLGSRRQRFWFALIGVIAISLPYSGTMVAAVKAALNPPAEAVSLPALTIPRAQFPELNVPKLRRYQAPTLPAASAAPAPAAATAGSTRSVSRVTQPSGAVQSRQPSAVVRHAAAPTQKAPVVTTSYGLPAPKKHRSKSAIAEAKALANAPVVTEVAPATPPMPASSATVPSPIAQAPSATATGTPPPVATPASPAAAPTAPVKHAMLRAAADVASDQPVASGSDASSSDPPDAAPDSSAPADSTASSSAATSPATSTTPPADQSDAAASQPSDQSSTDSSPQSSQPSDPSTTAPSSAPEPTVSSSSQTVSSSSSDQSISAPASAPTIHPTETSVTPVTTTEETEVIPASTTETVVPAPDPAATEAPAITITAAAPVAETTTFALSAPALASTPTLATVSSSSDATVISTPGPSNDVTGEAGTSSAGATSPTGSTPSLAASEANAPPDSDGATILASAETTPTDSAADPGSARGPPASSLNPLTLPELSAAVTAAEAEWLSVLPGASFAGISINIGTLPSPELGVTVGTTVTIDSYAGGYGWSQANPGDPGAMDLVTVVAHELGHVLGYGESSDPSNLMYEWLSPGETRTITSAAQLSGVPAYDTSSNDPVLQSAGPISISVGGLPATTLSVGSVAIGSTGTLTVTLTNTGSSPITGLTFSFGSGSTSPFKEVSLTTGTPATATTSLAAATNSGPGVDTLTLSFTAPNVEQLCSDTLTISGTVGSQAFTQEVAVSATPAPISFSPALSFSTTNVGSTTNLTGVTLTNVAGAALSNLSFSFGLASSSPFTITTASPLTSLASGGTGTLSFSFVGPGAIQTYTDTLDITGTWNNTSFTETVPISGAVTAPVGLTVGTTNETSGVAFGNTAVGSPVTVTATLSDAAGAAISNLAFAIASGSTSPFSVVGLVAACSSTSPPSGCPPTSLATTGTAPTQAFSFSAPGAPAPYADTLVITGTVNGVAFTEDVPLSATVQAPVGLSPLTTESNGSSAVDFGQITIGTSKTVAATITNNATTTISLLAVSFGSTTFSAASLSATSITSGNTATVNLTFTAPQTANPYSGTLTISGKLNGTAFTQTFAVTGVANAPSPLTFKVSSNTVTTLSFLGITVGNPGSLTVAISGPAGDSISGLQYAFASGSSSPFSVVSPPTTIGQGASASVNLAFAPQTAAGPYNDTLVVSGLLTIPAAGSTPAQTIPFTQSVAVTATVPIPLGLTVSSNPVSSLDFGSATIGPSGPGGTLSVTLTNQSGQTISGLGLSFASGASSLFSAPALTTAQQTLTNGASETVQLTFASTGYSPSYLDTLQITGTWTIPAFGSTPAQTVPFTQDVPVSAELPSTFETFQAAIAQELLEYESGGAVGSNPLAVTKTIPIGDLLLLASPTNLNFKTMSVSGSGSSALFTGEIDLTSGSATIASGGLSATFGAVTGSYILNGQAPGAGVLTLALQAPSGSSPSSITTPTFVVDSPSPITVVSTDNGARATTAFGATGAQATLSSGPSGSPTITLSNATLGMVAGSPDVTAAPGVALEVNGTPALSGVTATTLTGPAWSAVYDTAGNFGPVVVATCPSTSASCPAPATVVVSLSQPAGVSGAWSSLSGPGTLSLGSLGSIQGTYAVTAGASSLTLAATGALTQISAGTGAAAIQLSGASGSITLTSAGATGNDVSGQALLIGSSALTLSAPGQLTFSTTTPSFTITSTGPLQIGGLVGLDGSLAFTAGSGVINLSITGTPTPLSMQ
ncbi:MAG TPA: matrixin family metalloprotease, partial [Solirubrobacteraceae bacterium]|nr:matrixin family metalloprotease [Solirubrobacteraceae bacterium]